MRSWDKEDGGNGGDGGRQGGEDNDTRQRGGMMGKEVAAMIAMERRMPMMDWNGEEEDGECW